MKLVDEVVEALSGSSSNSYSNANTVFSKIRNCSKKPSFGSVAYLWVFTNSKASTSFIEKRRIINMSTLVAERDIPIAQWTRHLNLKSGLSLFIFLNSF